MTQTTPEDSGAEDLNSWITDELIRDPRKDSAEIAAELLRSRGNGNHEPDEGLISAMGRGWVLQQCGVEDTDENWEKVGLAWCARYNAGYWAAAEALLAAA